MSNMTLKSSRLSTVGSLGISEERNKELFLTRAHGALLHRGTI